MKDESPFRYPLNELEENGQLPVNSTAPAALFPDALTEGELLGTVKLDGMILAVDADASFTGDAKGKWRFECTRCLKPVEQAWRAPIEALVPIAEGHMDLTDEVRQSIALQQPMKIFCRPDCKGLCPTCGKNKNDVDCGHEGVPAAPPRTKDVESNPPSAPTRRPRLVPPKRRPE